MKRFIEVQSTQGATVIIRVDAISAISTSGDDNCRVWVSGIGVAFDVSLSRVDLIDLIEKAE